MKGNPKVLETLNALLADELTAINQYIVHAEMSDNWGYDKLHEHFEKRARDEMRHAEMLISRIIFLDGRPIVSSLNPIHIGAEVPAQFKNDHEAEATAIAAYNKGIIVAGDAADFATREVLEHILSDEDRHIDEIEEHLDQIDHMGLPLFLSVQV